MFDSIWKPTGVVTVRLTRADGSLITEQVQPNTFTLAGATRIAAKLAGEAGTLTREEVPSAGVAEVMKGLLRDLSHSIATLQPETQQSVPHARTRPHSTFPTGVPKSASLASLASLAPVKPGRAPLASIGANGVRALPPSLKGRAQTTASKPHTLNAFERPTMMRVDGLAKGSVSRLSII